MCVLYVYLTKAEAQDLVRVLCVLYCDVAEDSNNTDIYIQNASYVRVYGKIAIVPMLFFKVLKVHLQLLRRPPIQ